MHESLPGTEGGSLAALDYFESIARESERLESIKRQVAVLESKLEPKGQSYGATGHGGNTDRMFNLVVIRMQLTELQALESQLPRLKAQLEERIDRALDILYGKSGRGGLAKAKNSTDADILCCHYLQGMSWADIARDIARADTAYPTQWAIQRARRACDYIDRAGMDFLADS